MEVMGGHDPMDSTSLPSALPPMTAVLGHGVEGLRVGRIIEPARRR